MVYVKKRRSRTPDWVADLTVCKSNKPKTLHVFTKNEEQLEGVFKLMKNIVDPYIHKINYEAHMITLRNGATIHVESFKQS